MSKLTSTLAIPIIPNKEGSLLLSALYRHPHLSEQHDWFACPCGELHVTIERGLFEPATKSTDSWPVYRGKNINLHDCDANSNDRFAANPNNLLPYLHKKRTNSKSKSVWGLFSPSYLEDPETLPALRARIAYREVARATDRRTILTCLVPPHVFLASVGTLVFPQGDERDEAYLLGMLCSMPLDWLARRFAEAKITSDMIRSLPIPRLSRSNPIWLEIVNVSGRLAAKDQRFSDWASRVGVPCASYSNQEKAELLAKLDALSALAYELTEKQLAYIYCTFHGASQDYYEEHRKKAILYYRNLAGRTK